MDDVRHLPRELKIGAFDLRPAGEADVESYTAVVSAGHAHFARFEGWAQPTPSLPASQAWISYCDQAWRNGRSFVYVVHDRATDELVGSAGLHEVAGDSSLLTLGYWTAEHRCGEGVATLAAAALTVAAFALPQIERVEIHHDVANVVSARIPRRLAYRQRETRPRPRTAPEEHGVALIWEVQRAWFQKTYAHRLWVEEHV